MQLKSAGRDNDDPARHFLLKKTAKVYKVYVLAGLSVTRRLNLTDHIELLPFDDLPDHFGKHNSASYANVLQISQDSIAALQIRYCANPVLLHSGEPRYSQLVSRVIDGDLKRVLLLREMTALLTLLGPVAPVGIGTYC